MDNVIKFVPRVKGAGDNGAKPPRRRPPTTTNAGSSGGGWLKAGDRIVCKITRAEPGGYALTIPKLGLQGFLPSEKKLKPGDEVLANYVCVSNGRILVQSRFGQCTARDPNGEDA
jgi:hypothetical protein